MMLSRLILDLRSRDVRRDLGDAHDLHRTLMRAFASAVGPNPRAEAGLLYRIESSGTAPILLVQSVLSPDWGCLPSGYLATDWSGEENPATRDLSPLLGAIQSGQMFRFRLLANAARKIETASVDGQKRNGRRVPLRDDSARLQWLERRAEAAGFALVEASAGADVRTVPGAVAHGRRGGGNITVEGTLFDGRLRVVDAGLFRAALATGIGPGKAYGMGLLSLARA